MKMNHIRWIAIVGLIAIVELQYVWLVNTYKREFGIRIA